MNEFIETSVIELYDEHVQSRSDEGTKVAEAKLAIRDEVRLLVATTERDIDRETDDLLNSIIGSARSRRSRSMKKNLEHLLDGFDEGDTYIDPLLDMAFGLGDEHGVDKSLRFWTADDFANVVVTRFRVAAEVTEATAEFDRTVQRIVARMRGVGALTLGDVSWGNPDMAATA